jgi:hypothetical protein
MHLIGTYSKVGGLELFNTVYDLLTWQWRRRRWWW